MYYLLKSYLTNRESLVQSQDNESKLHSINASAPQESILGSILYPLYTTDIPTTPTATLSTFADDIAILAMHKDSETTSSIL